MAASDPVYTDPRVIHNLGMIKRKRPQTNRLLLGAITLLWGAVIGLLIALYQVMKRHGQTLLRLESMESHAAPQEEWNSEDPRQYLFAHGAPPGSVGMNFELADLDGRAVTMTQLKGHRVLLIFVDPDCPHSHTLLSGLGRLPAENSHARIVVISTGDHSTNREIADRYGIQSTMLVQEQNEVSLLYFISGTPMAYLLDAEGITEIDRIEGPQAILGVAFSLVSSLDSMPANQMTAADMSFGEQLEPTRRGDQIPDLQGEFLDGSRFHSGFLRGGRTLLVCIDPVSPPCIDLLPDLARVHLDPAQPDVLMISRRDPELTRQLANQYDMPYPIAIQRHWDVSRKLGVLAVPVACVVDSTGHMETDLAVGLQAVFGLLKHLRTTQAERRLVSLTSLLQG